MNIVTNLFNKKSKLIAFEILLIIFYSVLLFGELLEWFIFKDFAIFSNIMFWTLSTGNDLIILLYPTILLLIPIISILIYRKNYLNINLICLITLLIHIILYFYILIVSFYALQCTWSLFLRIWGLMIMRNQDY